MTNLDIAARTAAAGAAVGIAVGAVVGAAPRGTKIGAQIGANIRNCRRLALRERDHCIRIAVVGIRSELPVVS